MQSCSAAARPKFPSSTLSRIGQYFPSLSLDAKALFYETAAVIVLDLLRIKMQ